jgi:hypothetical protein
MACSTVLVQLQSVVVVVVVVVVVLDLVVVVVVVLDLVVVVLSQRLSRLRAVQPQSIQPTSC